MKKSDNIDLKQAIASANYTLLSDIDKDGTFQIQCDKGHVYKGRRNNFLKGHRCRLCSTESRRNRARRSLEDKLTKEGYTIISVPEDAGASAMYSLICPNGHDWSSAYSNLYQNHRCPMCNDNRSFGEKVIYNALRKDHINFEYQYRISENNQSYHYLDFLVQRSGMKPLIVEYDGLQHFKEDLRYPLPKKAMIERQARDAFKNNYAFEHKWEILRIPYTADSVKSIITALKKKLDIEYDDSYPYTSNIFNINDVTQYYLTHSITETHDEFNIGNDSVITWFRKRYNMSKTDYVQLHPEFDMAAKLSKKVAKYYLTNSIHDTMQKYNVGRTTVSMYFKQVYGHAKTTYSKLILNEAKSKPLNDILEKYDITSHEFNKLHLSLKFNQAKTSV